MDEEIYCETLIQINCENCSEKDDEPAHMEEIDVGIFQCKKCGNKVLIDLESIDKEEKNGNAKL